MPYQPPVGRKFERFDYAAKSYAPPERTGSTASDSAYIATPRPRPGVGVPAFLFPVAIAGSAVLLGIVAAIRPELALAGILGLILAPIIFARPIIGLCALVFMSFLETYSGLAGVVSVTKLIGAILILAWLAVAATSKSRDWSNRGLVSREPLLSAALVLFTGWAAASLAWAEAPSAGAQLGRPILAELALFPIAIIAIRNRGHVLWVVGTFLAGAFVVVSLGCWTVRSKRVVGDRLGGGSEPESAWDVPRGGSHRRRRPDRKSTLVAHISCGGVRHHRTCRDRSVDDAFAWRAHWAHGCVDSRSACDWARQTGIALFSSSWRSSEQSPFMRSRARRLRPTRDSSRAGRWNGT